MSACFNHAIASQVVSQPVPQLSVLADSIVTTLPVVQAALTKNQSLGAGITVGTIIALLQAGV